MNKLSKYAIHINSGYESKRYVVYTGHIFDGAVFQSNDERKLSQWLNQANETPNLPA